MKDRSTRRKRVLKGATIIQGITTSEIECVMRNQTEHGAELEVPLGAIVPDSFQLYVAVEGIAYDCVVRWRRSDQVGVEFVGRGPKPRHHYG
jgi:hypothetical protein